VVFVYPQGKHDVIGSKPVLVEFDGKKAHLETWRDVYLWVVKALLSKHPDQIRALVNKNIINSDGFDLVDATHVYRIQSPGRLETNLFLETYRTDEVIVGKIVRLMEKCGEKMEALKIWYIPVARPYPFENYQTSGAEESDAEVADSSDALSDHEEKESNPSEEETHEEQLAWMTKLFFTDREATDEEKAALAKFAEVYQGEEIKRESRRLPRPVEITPKQIKVKEGDTGITYRSLFQSLLMDETEISIQDPYITWSYQFENVVDFLHLVSVCKPKGETAKVHLFTKVTKTTRPGAVYDVAFPDQEETFRQIAEEIRKIGVEFTWEYKTDIHERFIILHNNKADITLGRGLDIYNKPDNILADRYPRYRTCHEFRLQIFPLTDD
jgi:hypothetical protein